MLTFSLRLDKFSVFFYLLQVKRIKILMNFENFETSFILKLHLKTFWWFCF